MMKILFVLLMAILGISSYIFALLLVVRMENKALGLITIALIASLCIFFFRWIFDIAGVKRKKGVSNKVKNIKG